MIRLETGYLYPGLPEVEEGKKRLAGLNR